jgi:subtilisin-like proprotein convertase family protein
VDGQAGMFTRGQGTSFDEVTIRTNDPAFTPEDDPDEPHAPVAADDSATTDQDIPVTVSLLENDTDADGDPLQVSQFTQPLNGTVTVNPDGVATYTPAAGFTGTDSFTYRVTDGVSESNQAVVTLQVNPVAPVQSDYQNTVPTVILDRKSVFSQITISDAFAIKDINVTLNITHSRESDLQVFLHGPDGTVVELFSNVGGSGKGFFDTVLDDEASVSITDGTSPFTGVYKPEQSLEAFDGKNVTGTWTLEIRDTVKKETGKLNSWSLSFEK